MKSEDDDEEEPQSSQLHHRPTEEIKTEAGGEDCGGPEPARTSDPHRYLQPKNDDSAEPETGDTAEPTSQCVYMHSLVTLQP